MSMDHWQFISIEYGDRLSGHRTSWAATQNLFAGSVYHAAAFPAYSATSGLNVGPIEGLSGLQDQILQLLSAFPEPFVLRPRLRFFFRFAVL
ncbi:hypothetical protein O5541_01940 [Escherichia coli]|nr:hypothetical protein [Escherichia coli]